MRRFQSYFKMAPVRWNMRTGSTLIYKMSPVYNTEKFLVAPRWLWCHRKILFSVWVYDVRQYYFQYRCAQENCDRLPDKYSHPASVYKRGEELWVWGEGDVTLKKKAEGKQKCVKLWDVWAASKESRALCSSSHLLCCSQTVQKSVLYSNGAISQEHLNSSEKQKH